jgi:competence protein ComEC
MQRKTKPIGLLVVAATILLLYNPLWIWDLGFQLSFLATLGLVVTVIPLIKQLDWLPPAIASPIAVTIAASLWTLPLLLYVFGLVAPYSIAANIIATPVISVITIGGVISALVALIWPFAGSALAWLLYYPTHWLIAIVQFFCSLPGNSVAVGRISVLQIIALYGLIVLVWQLQWWHRRWWLAALVAVAAIAIPIWQTNLALFRVTVLATGFEQVMVIQDQGKVLLVNSGDAATASFTVLPFLQQQGVNQLEWAVGLDSAPRARSGWLELLKRIACKNFYINQAAKDIPGQAQKLGLQQMLRGKLVVSSLPVGKTVPVGSTAIKLISAEPPVLLAQIRQQNWLLLGNIEPDAQKQLATSGRLPRAQVLYWSGASLTPELLDALQPVVAIASSTTVDSDTEQNLQKSNTKLYWTGRDGAIQWTPADEFEPMQEATDNNWQML